MKRYRDRIFDIAVIGCVAAILSLDIQSGEFTEMVKLQEVHVFRDSSFNEMVSIKCVPVITEVISAVEQSITEMVSKHPDFLYSRDWDADESYIQRLEDENGDVNPSIEIMCKLSKALNIAVESLFSCD